MKEGGVMHCGIIDRLLHLCIDGNLDDFFL